MNSTELDDLGTRYNKLKNSVDEYNKTYKGKIKNYIQTYAKLESDEEKRILKVQSKLDMCNASHTIKEIERDKNRLIETVRDENRGIKPGSLKDLIYKFTAKFGTVLISLLMVWLLVPCTILITKLNSMIAPNGVDGSKSVLSKSVEYLGVLVEPYTGISLCMVVITLMVYVVLKYKYKLNLITLTDGVENSSMYMYEGYINTYKLEDDLINLSKGIQDSVADFNTLSKEFESFN